MNIKKSPLMAGLLTLSAVFGSMVGKAEAPKYQITNEDMGNMFTNQTEVASFQVNGVDVHVMTGWSKTQEWIENGYQSRTLTAPFIVSKDGAAFTGAFAGVPADIKTIAVNEDNGKVYAFKVGRSGTFYEMNFGTGTVTSTEPLKVLHQLNPSVGQTLEFYSANSQSSQKQQATVEHAIAWTDKSAGEYILTYNPNGGQNRTTVWHRNGVVNRYDQFAGIEPVDVLKGKNVIYYGNVTNNQLVSISKSNPVGETSVQLRSDRVGIGVIGDTLYQANASSIHDQNGQLGIEYKVTYGGTSFWLTQAQLEKQIDIKDMTVSHDGQKLVIACDPNESKDVLDLRLSDSTPIIAVQGATKVEARQDGIYAMIKNQMQKVQVHE